MKTKLKMHGKKIFYILPLLLCLLIAVAVGTTFAKFSVSDTLEWEGFTVQKATLQENMGGSAGTNHYYTTNAGDTFQSIADYYGMGVDELGELSGNKELYDKYGAKGVLPGGLRVQIPNEYWKE